VPTDTTWFWTFFMNRFGGFIVRHIIPSKVIKLTPLLEF